MQKWATVPKARPIQKASHYAIALICLLENERCWIKGGSESGGDPVKGGCY